MGALRFYAPYLKEHGCAGVSYTAYGLIMQELETRRLGVSARWRRWQGALAIQAIQSFGSPEQHARWLPGLVSGERVGCFALTEHGHGSDPGGMETHATREGDHYILNGSKCWIGNASTADVKVVWAKDDDGHVGGFVVEKDASGFRARDIEGKFSLRMSRTSECWFENCRILAENRLPNASGLRAPLSCLSYARVGNCVGRHRAPAIDCLRNSAGGTPKRANNSGAQLAASNSCNKNLFWDGPGNHQGAVIGAPSYAPDGGRHIASCTDLNGERNNVLMALQCARKAAGRSWRRRHHRSAFPPFGIL